MKKCLHCNAELDDLAKFCPICGLPISDKEDTSYSTEPLPVKLDPLNSRNTQLHPHSPKSRPKWLPILCGALLLIFLWPVLFGRGGPAKTPTEKAEEYYKQAQSEYTLGNYQKALSYLEDAIKADPEYTPAIELREEILPLRAAQHLYSAKEYQAKGDYLSAQSQLRMALELDPYNTEAAELLSALETLAAEQQLRQKEEDAAAEEVRQAEVADLLDHYEFNGELAVRIAVLSHGDFYSYRYGELQHDATGAYYPVSMWSSLGKEETFSSCYKVYESGEEEWLIGFDRDDAAKAHTPATYILTPKEQPETPVSSLTPSSPIPINLLDSMSDTEYQKLNVFLSNFSEQPDFQSFDYKDYSASQLIDFAYFQSYRNNPSIVTYDNGSSAVISEDVIQSTIGRFFGLTVEPQSTDILTLYNGQYYWEEAIGNSITYFSIADEMLENGDGTYTLSFSIYSYSEFDAVIPLENTYTLTDDELQGQPGIQFENSGNAIIQDSTYKDEPCYCLLNYSAVSTGSADEHFSESIGAITLTTGEIYEFFETSPSVLCHTLNKFTSVQLSQFYDIFSGQNVYFYGTITGVHQDGSVTIHCIDEEASEAAGLMWPMMAIVTLHTDLAQKELVRLSVDDEVIAIGSISDGCYSSVLGVRSLDLANGRIIVSPYINLLP